MKREGMMKYLFFLGLLVAFASCQKDEMNPDNSFVCTLSSEEDYLTRNCFQLQDGSFIISGNSDHGSLMAKYSDAADLLWQKELPGALFDLKKGIPLSSGGFVLAGADSIVNQWGVSQNGKITLVRFDNNGEAVDSVVIGSTPFMSVTIQLDLIQLKNGYLALMMCPIAGGSSFAYPRLVILDLNFNTLFDQVYYSSPGIPFKSLYLPGIQEANNGSIYFCYQYWDNVPHGFLMKLNSDYSMSFYTDSLGLSDYNLPGSFVLDEDDNCLIASAKQVESSPYAYVYYHPNESFSMGREVSVLRTDKAGNFIDRHDYGVLPANASIMKIIRSVDGGFVMIGTSNQKEKFTTVSNTNIFLMKTDAGLNRLWIREFKTAYPSVAYDVFETRDGGFAIGAFMRSFNGNFQLMIIKTDFSGN